MALPPQQNPYPRPVQRELKFDVIGEAFTALVAHWKVIGVAGAIVCAPILLMIVALLGFVFLVMFPAANSGGELPMFMMFSFQIVVLFGILFVYAAAGPGHIGCARLALAIRRREPLTVEMAKAGLPRFVPGSIAGLINYAGVLIGSYCCYVPGLLWGGLTTGAFMAMAIDENLSAGDAIKESLEVMKPQMWMAALLYLLVSMISSIGSIALIVGLVFTMPLLSIIMGLAYLDMKFGIGQSDQPVGTAPSVSP